MTTAKKTEGPTMSRQEKIEEILTILGELYQRFGYQQAAAVAGTVAPEYRFVGYRPYSPSELQRWAREYVGAGGPVMPWPGYAPQQTEPVPAAPFVRY